MSSELQWLGWVVMILEKDWWSIMGLTHVQWVIRKIPLDKGSLPSHPCGTSKASQYGPYSSARWVTKVIRQLILAPTSIGANDIKAAPCVDKTNFDERWLRNLWSPKAPKQMPFQSTSFQTVVQPCKDLIDYHCITHRFGYASHAEAETYKQCHAFLSRERWFWFFLSPTEINEQPFRSWQTCIQIRSLRIDVEIFSVILGKISAQPYHHWQLAFQFRPKKVFFNRFSYFTPRQLQT